MLASEEEAARSKIGTLQWYASLTRPDICYDLAEILSELNREKNTEVYKKINRTIVKLKNQRKYIHKIVPIRGAMEIEIYGDSAFKNNSSQQGLAVVFRECQSQKANLISWRSNGSDRKPWSSVAAETHISQIAMDKAIHLQNLCVELDCFIMRTVVLTDILSLRRVVYSGRPTKEMRLRREIAAIRDMIVRDGIQFRHVPSAEMVADPLTKSMDGGKLLKLGGENFLEIIEHFDSGKTTEKDLLEANQEIEMDTLSERLENIRKEYEARRAVKGDGTSRRIVRSARANTANRIDETKTCLN